MKKVVLIMFLSISFECFGQNLSYVSKTYGGGYTLKVIQPTIENFIKLCDMDDSQFISAMKQCGYFPTEDSGNPIEYWNGSIDNFAYASAVNTFTFNILTDWVGYMVAKEYVYPQESITNLIKSLKPYYYARNNAIYDSAPSDVFKLERDGKVYAIFITDLGKYFDVHARIFQK